MSYLIIVTGDWNDSDYIYNHIFTDDENEVNYAITARDFLNKNRDIDVEYLRVFDCYEDTEEFAELTEKYGQYTCESLDWLCNAIPYGYNCDINNLVSIEIFEIGKKL